ncbi:MAG: arginine repressor [Clostridia bacterium]|nr:arginine repressor [Clostridia bacterium]
MSRTSRQSHILQIITENDIETQDELVEALSLAGYQTTQATISRDIKELGLIKTLTPQNTYKYVTKQAVDARISSKLMNVLREAVISIVVAQNLVVVKVIDDSASVVSNALEQLSMPQVVGMVADRNTILVICVNDLNAVEVSSKIQRLL